MIDYSIVQQSIVSIVFDLIVVFFECFHWPKKVSQDHHHHLQIATKISVIWIITTKHSKRIQKIGLNHFSVCLLWYRCIEVFVSRTLFVYRVWWPKLLISDNAVTIFLDIETPTKKSMNKNNAQHQNDPTSDWILISVSKFGSKTWY